jgi:glutathione synthase/RimK-type ligase-like ATP-grasp enzyme
MTAVVLVEQPDAWRHLCPHLAAKAGLRVLDVRDYLQDGLHEGAVVGDRDLVVNLADTQDYQSNGYYCSLLAEARGHRVVPTVRTSLDLQQGATFRPRAGLDAATRRFLLALPDNRHTVDVMFGQTAEPALAELARELFDSFRAPFLRLELHRDDEGERRTWRIHAISQLTLGQLTPEQHVDVGPALERWLTRRWRTPRSRPRPRQRLAILHDPNEASPPSNRKAIKRFIEAATAQGIAAEPITQHDRARLGEFDGLFLRVTTSVDHYSYQMACQAEREGLVVIDDPQSIIRCSNKVYLAELLRRHNLPMPTSLIVGPRDLDRAEQVCGYPIVLKVPDGSFSRGVFKVRDRAELEAQAQLMFQRSELIVAQAYTYTEFDWRIGVLANEPLFASKYHMAKHHWQVYKHAEGGSRYGSSEAVPLADVPREVFDAALGATRLIGEGLYGVDLKQKLDGEVVIIEVNDNPNIDSPYEDRDLGQGLWARLVGEFARRMAC